MVWCGVRHVVRCGVVWQGVVYGWHVVWGIGQATGQAIIAVHGGSHQIEEGVDSGKLVMLRMLMMKRSSG